MSYNLLNNFKLAFDKALKHFKFIEYSYQLIDNNIYLHINFNINYIINYKLQPLHIKITTRSLYVVDSLYLALFQTITQYIQKYIRNFNYLSYVYNQNNDILYCIIDFDNTKRDYLIGNCLIINDNSFNENVSFSKPIIINDIIIKNNNRFGFIEWNDIFDKEFEKDF